jgi:hypothetical protein
MKKSGGRFLVCSHLNPIDPAEYRVCERFEEEYRRVRPDAKRAVPAKAPAERSCGRLDRIVPIPPDAWRGGFDGLGESPRGRASDAR